MEAALLPRLSFATLRSSSSSCRRGTSPRLLSRRRGFPAFRRRRPSLAIVLRVEATSSSAPSLWASAEGRGADDPVEVIGIGSRIDSLIDFCLNSPSISSSRLRFWTIQTTDSHNVQLLQRCHGTDVVLRNAELPLSMQPCPPALILVATSGFGLDYISTVELLKAVKSAGRLSVAIILKPFNFEGQRRREEVDTLVKKLKNCVDFQIVVDADALLKRETETLAEAVETVNNAVSLAISTVSVLMSESHIKLHSSFDEQMKELSSLEVIKMLQTYGEAKISFGASYDIKSAFRQAVFNCPFLGGGVKGLNGSVIINVISACGFDKGELLSLIQTFHQISECSAAVIISSIKEPALEPNFVVVTLLIVGYKQKAVLQKKGFLSSLILHFPIISSLLGMNLSEPKDDIAMSSFNCFTVEDKESVKSANGAINYSDSAIEEMKNQVSGKNISADDINDVRSVMFSDQGVHEQQDVQNEQSSIWNIGPGFHIAQLWAKERSSTSKVDGIEIFSLPVGVKSFDSSCHSLRDDSALSESLDKRKSGKTSIGSQNFSSGDTLTESGLDAVIEIYNSALTLIKGKNVDEIRSGGGVSARAASMLEVERESKSWTPVTEIQYRGGTYRGRCQGGLPEGKGRLTFPDGGFYDGMWHNGQRSGVGTLCYSNGDVFQGSWRDDLMHGKGWFYFRSGDRWFANFWKGKANGEGRFYSSNGSIFFGNFKDGWRNGPSLFIDTDGLRWSETWDDGVLISRNQLE